MDCKNLGILISTLLISFNLNAAILSANYQTSGDNLITHDTATGLDWLDLTETAGLSYDYVASQFGVGGEFEGWRFATIYEVSRFFDAFGGYSHNGQYGSGHDDANYKLFESIAPKWGDLACEQSGCVKGSGQSRFFTGDVQYGYGRITGTQYGAWEPDYAIVAPDYGSYTGASIYYGSALVRSGVPPIPVPATAWLFGSALLGLIGISRKGKE